MSEEETGYRESPMARNGGISIGEPDPDRYHRAVYDGGPGFPPGGAGRSYPGGHPPLDCPNPRIMASMRGLYRCPACAGKLRLADDRSARDAGYDTADAIGGAVATGITWAWDIAWLSACAIARGLAWAASWAAHRITTAYRNRQGDTSAIVDSHHETQGQRDQSQAENAPESSQETVRQQADPAQDPGILTCSETSDGTHVPGFTMAGTRCIACEMEINNA